MTRSEQGFRYQREQDEKRLKARQDPAYHKDVDFDVEEHGQRWAVCRPCGAQWSINESNLGDDYEQVTEGDGYCEEESK